MRKKLSLLLSLLLCLGLAPIVYADNSPFTDVAPDFWAYEEIMEAYNAGVMTGTGTTESGGKIFTPSGKLNMAQFVTVLTRAFYNEDVVNSLQSETWPNRNYDAAEKHNLFSGLTFYSSGVEVTREVMAQMMYNVMLDKGAILPSDSEIQMTMNKIADLTTVDSNFRTAVAVCYYLNLLSGVDAKGTFAPKGVLNRAQTAVIYTRLNKAIDVLGTGATNPGTTNSGTTQTPNTSQPTSGATLTNGMPVTEENVLALIEEYRNGKEPGEKARAAGFTSYMDGATYDAYNPTYFLDPFGNGKECAKFAYAFWDDIFGADAPIREVTDPADVRPGDLLQAPGHWSIATIHAFDYKGRGPHVQAVGGGSAGVIGWTSGGYGKLASEGKFYTRYPD